MESQGSNYRKKEKQKMKMVLWAYFFLSFNSTQVNGNPDRILKCNDYKILCFICQTVQEVFYNDI